MPGFIDFAELKEKVSFASAIEHLELNLKRSGAQWRGACPACERAGERALVITDGKGWYCWGERKGGDVIALAAHVLGIPAKEAAQELASRAGIVPVPERNSTSRTVQSRTEPESEEEQGFAPLAYLEPEHDAVIAIGFDPAVAKALGIGYAPRGIMRGTVAVPVRDERGVLKGYIGIEDARLPADFQTNVIPLKRRA